MVFVFFNNGFNKMKVIRIVTQWDTYWYIEMDNNILISGDDSVKRGTNNNGSWGVKSWKANNKIRKTDLQFPFF